MIKLNFVTGLIVGVSITLALVFAAQAYKNLGRVQPRQDYDRTRPSNFVGNTSGSKTLGSTSDAGPTSFQLALMEQSPDLVSPRTTPPRHAKRYVPDCDAACTAAIRSKLINSEDLSSLDWDTIKESGEQLSRAIVSEPEVIRALLDRINYSSDPEEVDGLMTLVGLFPDDLALELIRDVASYSSGHKKVALRALSSLSMHSVEATREIETLLNDERDPQLIAVALDALETTDNYQFNEHTWRGLSAKFEYVEDQQLKGAILTALAKHGKGDLQSLKQNVALGLSSDSSFLQQSSIEALGYLLSEPDNESSFNTDQIRSQLYIIANNVNAKNSVRINALHLLDESF